jgi:hypothetical protein
MSKISSHHFNGNIFPAAFTIKPTLFFGLTIAVLLAAISPVAAQDAKEDQYVQIYTLIQQADSLNKNGETNRAATKYAQAQVALRKFQKTYPDWNARVVGFRSNYLAQRIAALAQSSSAAEASGDAKSTGTGAVQVKLLEAGAEPRKVLRLHPAVGDKQAVHLAIKMGMDMKMGETQTPAVKMPVMKMVMDMTVKTVSPEGDIAYDMVLSDAGLGDDPDVLPQVADAMKKSLEGVKGMTGTGIISSRGVNKSSDIKIPAKADAQMLQSMEQMKDSLSKISSPLPEEAVGPGAKWQVKMPVKSQSITIDQTITYELISIEEERAEMKLQIEQRAANQKMQSPAMPNLKLDLVNMTGNGGGTMTLDQTKMVSPLATLDTHSELSLNMNNGGQKQSMTMKVDLNLQIETK